MTGILARMQTPTFLLALLCSTAALAQTPKLPIQSDDKGSVYVNPNVESSDKSIDTRGATVGVEKKDGSGVYGGVDTSTPRPTYSMGGATGGDVSFSAGATTDGKANTGVKAGVTIKY